MQITKILVSLIWGSLAPPLLLHHTFQTPTAGYYLPEKRSQTDRDAQIEMIERTLSFAGVEKATNMIDVGCGIGGSSRYICSKYGCSGEGVTLSPI